MDEFIRLNIAIIPSKEVAREAIKLSQDFGKKYPTKFILDGKNFIPHITCYSPEFPSKNLALISKEIEKFVENTEVFQVSLDGLNTNQEGDSEIIEIVILKTNDLINFHELVIQRLNPLREGYIREKYRNPEYVEKFPADKRELMKNIMLKVGYPRVLEAYEPHISITRLDSSISKDSIRLPKLKCKTMKVEKLGIFTMGEYGTCNKMLYEFALKK